MPVLLDGTQALRGLRTFTVPFGATATTATGAFTSRLIRLHTTQAVCVSLEGGAASTATCPRLAADQTEYFRVATAFTIGAISDGTDGTLYVTECG